MADLTATQINTYLGTTVFDDNAGAGPLTLDLSALTGDTLTLSSDLAEAIFKTLKAASDTAADLGQSTDTYPAITRTIATVNGSPVTRMGASVNVAAPLSYDDVTSLS
jgi:hypothetical protein